MDAFDRMPWGSSEAKPKFQRNNGKGDAFDRMPDSGQSPGEYASRLAGSAATGYASGTPYGLLTNFINLLAMGDVNDPEEMERIKAISEREGIPFDEEKYREAGQQALGSFPTPSNIARMAEEATGAPITPKDRFQKGVEFATMASKLAPKPGTFRGMETALPKPVLGTGVEAAKEGLVELGVPEPFADVASFAVLKTLPEGAPSLKYGKEKPSGLTERGFEKLKEPTAVPEKKIQQINEKIEKDFREISDVIVKDSPIGETAENLANNVTFKQESRELLNQAQEIANSLPDVIPSKSLKKEIIDIGAKNIKGISLNEYDKSYMKFMKEALEDIIPEKVSLGELVETYRKNNRSLSEYFEPGASKALNRAKRDAILDQNRAIANLIEKSNPELSEVFKDGNSRWTKIMDAEAVDTFVSDVFQERINFKKLHDFFDKSGYDRIFKRALGEEGYKNFEKLVIDMLSSEKPYKMLKVAKEKGYSDVANTLMGYIIHPKIGIAKAGMDTVKNSYRFLMNAMLDKPQIGITFNKGMKEFNKGNFAAAEKEFKTIEAEILAKEEAPIVQPKAETIEVTPEKIENIKPEPKRLEAPEEKPKTKENTYKQNGVEFKEISISNSKNETIGKINYSEFKDPASFNINMIESSPGENVFLDLLRKLHDKNPDATIMGSNFTEQGAKIFSKLTGKKIKPYSFDQKDTIIIHPYEIKDIINRYSKKTK
jgi:hypothetical protein